MSDRVHELKTWPGFFDAIEDGSKTFEIRRDDRGFAVGDVLLLREYAPGLDSYTGREVRRRVTYKLDQIDAAIFGVRDGFCVMGLADDAKDAHIATLEARVAAAEAERDRLRDALSAACGYLLNAKIDLETGAPKRTAIATIDGGLKMVRAVLTPTEADHGR